jgi:hypothetical protein
MGSVIAIAVVLCTFLMRDFLVFRMSNGTTPRRLIIYGLALTVYLGGFLIAVRSLSAKEIFHDLRSPVAALTLLAVHLFLAGVCFWMRHAGRYDRAWLVVAAPNPLLVSCLAISSRVLLIPQGAWENCAIVCATCGLWIAVLWLAIRWSSRTPVDPLELDFSFQFAGIANGFALMFVPFEILFG